jgi:shikimate dehydrogenase
LGVQEAIKVYEWRDAPASDYAVIGDPVAHTLSPRMHKAAYEKCNLDLCYEAIRIPKGETHEALEHLRNLGYQGVNVTLPHKQEVIGWLSDIDPFASRVQAVNTIRLDDRYGFNTDAPGFMKTLDLLNIQPGTPTLILGAGGSARAIVAALAEEDFPLRIWNRTRERAENLLEELEIEASVWDQPEILDAGLIVNTTSASLQGIQIPIDWSHTMPGAIAYDIAYNGTSMPFLQDAITNGVRSYDGKGMLVMQGALAFEWWLGIEAPHDVMWESIH